MADHDANPLLDAVGQAHDKNHLVLIDCGGFDSDINRKAIAASDLVIMPALVKQELWGMLLAYNLLRFMMCQMAYSLNTVMPYQIGFKQASIFWVSQLQMLSAVAPGRYPEVLRYTLDMAESFVLPERRERTYPRAVKKRPGRYATRPSRKRNLA